MTEMNDKKGKLKITVELEVNEELMDVVKDAMSKAEKTNSKYSISNNFKFFFIFFG